MLLRVLDVTPIRVILPHKKGLQTSSAVLRGWPLPVALTDADLVCTGAAHARLVHAGARAALHEDWSLADLCETLWRGHYPIVGVERHLLGHPPESHAIVVQITSRAVHVLDPVEGPQPQRYGREAFVLAWQMAGREALVLEAPLPRPAS